MKYFISDYKPAPLPFFTLLNEEEASVIQDITMAEPRPRDVFDQVKKRIFGRYDRPTFNA